MATLAVNALAIWLGSLFSYAAALKLVRLGMTPDIPRYRLVPAPVAPVIGYALPGIEFCVGVLLLAGYAPALAGALALGLGLSFAIVTFDANRSGEGERLPCGCTGDPNEAGGWIGFFRALAIAASGAAILFFRPDPLPVYVGTAFFIASISPAARALLARRRFARRAHAHTADAREEVQRLTELLAATRR